MKADLYQKFVYRPVGNGQYVRCSYEHTSTLKQDFYYVGVAFESPDTIREHFLHNGCYATAWKDKHGNVIVRVIANVKQTKIDFQNV